MSRVAKKPVDLPQGVTVTIGADAVTVKGAKGSLTLPLKSGMTSEVTVTPIGPRHFQLAPWPFEARELEFAFPARHVLGHNFESSAALDEAFQKAEPDRLMVKLSAG